MSDWFRDGHFNPNRGEEYLQELLADLRTRLARVEAAKARIVSAPVTAVNTGASTFTVTMPAQQDGASTSLAGIAAPSDFLPSVGQTVQLSMIGSVPTYLPKQVAAGVIGSTELDGTTNTTISNASSNATNAITQVTAKTTVFRSPSQPTALAVGDVWIDTDDGNKEYIWAPIGTIARTNLALNPSFEADAVGTLTVITGWTNYTNLTPGTLTRSVVNTGTGIADKIRAGKVVSASLPATTNTAMGYQQVFTAVPGDAFRIQMVVTVAVTDSNKLPEFVVEFLNASNTLIGSATSTTGSGSSTAQQTLSTTTAAAPALTASMRLTVRRRSNGSGVALTNGDLIVDAVLVEKNVSATTQAGYFDGDTLSNGDTLWNTPGAKPNSTSAYWQDSIAGANQWYPMKLRTGALEPGSLQASNILASGTITATLLEAVLVLTNIVIAGDPAGTHAAMKPDGFHVFDQSAAEVIRLGTTSNDYFGVVNALGALLASIDDTGGGQFQDLNVANDPVFQGTHFSDYVANASGGGGNDTPYPGARHFYGWADGSITNVTTEIGIIEIATYVDSNRIYLVTPQVYLDRTSATVADVKVRDGGSSSPTISSTIITEDFFTDGDAGQFFLAETGRLWKPSTTGTHRLLLTVSNNGGGGHVDVLNWRPPTIIVQDMGPYHGNPASVNRGGGSTPPPTQQYYTELAPSGWNSYRGNGTVRTDTTDVVQGWDPSGFNGDGSGFWWFPIPTITGTVDRVDFAVYTNLTYYNSGGTGILNYLSGGAGWSGGDVTNKIYADSYYPGYPKPGWKTLTLNSGTFSQFRTAAVPQVVAMSMGNAGTTDETYYCRFDGPSARLRIWYTQ